MSWAANRQTTRVEDRAYCLMELFGIHMPMLFGGGESAFKRLQEEVIRTTPDDFVFAWRAREGSLSSYRGLLATSPDDFEGSRNITKGFGTFNISNLGLQIETKLSPLSDGDVCFRSEGSLFTCFLDTIEKVKQVALLIRHLYLKLYARVAAHRFSTWSGTGRTTTLYFEHNPQIPREFTSRAMHCFYLRRSSHKTVSEYKR
jgi:hypothetical protein